MEANRPSLQRLGFPLICTNGENVYGICEGTRVEAMREQMRSGTISYDAEVLAGRRVPLPRNAALSPGQKVHVELRVKKARRAKASSQRDSLWQIVGLCRTTGRGDVGERHDCYLYSRYGSKKAGKR